MRTLSDALATACGAAITSPAFLVEISFDPVLRMSTFDDVYHPGESAWFTRADVRVNGVNVDKVKVSGSIAIGNADDLVAALILGQGVSDRRIRVWGYDAGAVEAADFVLLLDCVGGEASIDPDAALATIGLRDAAEFTFSPRVTVCASNGFRQLLAAGTVLTINQQTYRIERR